MTVNRSGLLLVDKPIGPTSHDIVGRMRRLAGTRRVGHAGTLDPAAGGLLVIGIHHATRLLTFATGLDKTYETVMRLGLATVTDDAEGETVSAPGCTAPDDDVAAAVRALTGPIQQVPSAVSAVKIDGRRAYARVRAGEDVQLAARPVTVHRFHVTGIMRTTAAAPDGADLPVLDVHAVVDCTSGTYIRALARDLGAALGAAGHLTALRRTAVGPWSVDAARTLDDLTGGIADGDVTGMGEAAGLLMDTVTVGAERAVELTRGRRIPVTGVDHLFAVLDGAGRLVAIADPVDGHARTRLVIPEDARS